MEIQFVANGESNLVLAPRLRELRKSIRAKHAAELAKADFIHRLVLRWHMAAEYRRERRRLVPSPYSLFAGN